MTSAPPLLDPAHFLDHDGPGLFRLAADDGLQAAVSPHGARLLQLLVPDARGRLHDVVLGHDSLPQLRTGIASMGAFIGRFANRIGNARFGLDGRAWQLPANDGPHCLHGGPAGSRYQRFAVLSQAPEELVLAWTFREAQDGFPGDVALQVRYALEDGALVLAHEARVLRGPTVLNFTGHAFFDLDGGGDVRGHRFTVDADRLLRVDAGKIPTGDVDAVQGTGFDLRRPRVLREALAATGLAGLDHCYVPGGSGLRRMARVEAESSGLALEVWSDAPGLQVYTGAGLDGSLPRHAGKHGRTYGPHAGFCLEPQGFPDAPNHPHFPSATYREGETCRGRIEYRFSHAA
ncbi:MAG TPA: aldose epimerase family protein [Ramlibacter sp.]|nr:aldose epimerase family protein [Ramlibacter sp.]